MDEPLRVLIAEDETIIRLDLRGLLERHGLRVCGEARDGEEAVRLARELEPDVVAARLSDAARWTASRRRAGSMRSDPCRSSC